MKNIFLIFVLMVAFSCSRSQDNISGTWSAITYNFNGGQASQGYQNNYSVVINSDKSCVFIYRFPENDLTKEFVIDDNSLTKLSELIKASQILTADITTDPMYALSADMRSCSIVLKQNDPNLDQPPRVISIPFNPSEEFKEGLNNLYDFIETLIPVETRKDFEMKRSEYFNNKK
jgi:hypothetical protein